MNSAIARAVNLGTEPVALLLTDDKPEGAVQFEKGKWGCVLSMFGAVATKGRSAVFDRETYGCFGGGLGLGFGNAYLNFPGGEEGFCNFLSHGNEGWEQGRRIGEGMRAGGARPEFVHHFLHGERYKKNPELVRAFIDALPITEIPTRYVAFLPLSAIDPVGQQPESITFLVNADQLSALTVFANYDRPGLDNVAIPYAAGCQVIGVLAYREARSEQQRCLVGLTDISSRQYLRVQTGKEVMSFTIPFRRFLELEENVGGSFLEQEPWVRLR